VLRLRFFAALRERLGTGALELPYTAGCATVAGLVEELAAGPLPGCGEYLRSPNTLVAVNRVVASRDARIGDGDEVAFYPPVTGG